jgi:hypothetical protein
MGKIVVDVFKKPIIQWTPPIIAVIEFKLDDSKKTSIRKEISIKKDSISSFGASFCSV